MKDLPIVCVVMPAYNSAETLGAAASSVLRQDYGRLRLAISVYPHDFETIAAAEALEDERVVIVRRNGRGVANGRNCAIRTVQADLYMFLDSDDTYDRNVITPYVRDFLASSEPVLRYGDWTGISPLTGRHRVRTCPAPRRRQYEQLLIDNFVATGTVMVDARILADVGLFDEREEYNYVEDWELWLRIARRFPLRRVALNTFFYTETKRQRLVPRTFFEREISIVRRQPVGRALRTLAIGLARGRCAAYYLRTFPSRKTARQRLDFRALDLIALPALTMLKLYRFRRLEL